MSSKPTLLIVDDEQPILDSVQRLFRRTFEVMTAPSGQAGLDLLGQQPAQIILSDQRMPDITGDEFLSRARELVPESVRILFTGYADIEAVTRAVNRGKIYGYLAKPWNTADLETLVHQAAQHYDLADVNRRLTVELRAANALLEKKVGERTRELEDAEDYKESLLRSQGGGMLVIDLTGMVRSFNPAGEAILGLGSGIVEGKLFSEVPALAPFAEELRSSLARGDRGEYQETEIALTDGDTRYLGYVVNPLLMRTGDRKGAVMSFSDITEKRQIEIQLNQTEKLSMIGQLAGGVAHEINNPLGVILGFAQILLKQTPDNDQNLRRLQNIERQALRCKEIVSKLLKFARRSRMKNGPVRVNAVMEEVIGLIGRQLEMEHIALVTRLAPDLPEISGDENELEQVFFNLLVNARDALASAGPESQGNLRLDVESVLAGKFVELRVSDTGTGIPPGVRAKIFDPFFTTKEPGHGTGLGLSVSRGIIERHGGELTLEDRTEPGTTFLVRLPLPTKPPEMISMPPEPEAKPTKGMRILVVDDEEDIRDICADYLGEQNQVVTVMSGKLALEVLQREKFGLMLLDVMMPEMDGVATLEKARALGVDVPVVIMTGKTDERIMMTQNRLGVLEILEKPFSIAELERVLERVGSSAKPGS